MDLKNIKIIKKKISYFKKGSSTVELVIIIPIIIAFLFLTWELSSVFFAKLKAIEAVHYAVWEKVDTRKNSMDNFDPRSNNSIKLEAENIARSSGAITSIDIWEEQSFIIAPNYQVNAAMRGFGLNTYGKWLSKIRQSYTYGQRLKVTDSLLKGPNFSYIIPMTFQESLLTDSWEVRRTGSAHNIVYNRVTGGFYEMIGSYMEFIVKNFINFSIFGKKIGPDEPRINLEAVPPKK